MPKKKAVPKAASEVAARRTTRRQTILQQNEASELPDDLEEPPPAPDVINTATSIPTEVADIAPRGSVHDGNDKIEEMAVDPTPKPDIEGLPFEHSEPVRHLENGPSLPVESIVPLEMELSTPNPIPASDGGDVSEIGEAITNIKIESEPVHTPSSSRPATPVTVVKQEDDQGDNSKDGMETEDDALSIRRSSRIKTITKKQKKSRGHGLVRDKDKMKLSIDGDVSSPVPPSPGTPVCPPPQTPCDEMKPQKIKSRWLDSAKRESLDLNDSLATTSESLTSLTLPPNSLPAPVAPPAAPTPVTAPVDYYARDPEVVECLKRLNQIKDNIYNCERNISKEAKKMTCDCFLTQEEKESGEMACGEDCLNRMLMIECGSRCAVGDRCTNRRFQNHQYAPVVVFKTEKKGFGLRAASEIQAGEFIMEYVGEVLNAKQFEKRANAYSKDKNKHYYFMALRSDAVIDATGKGNISRFINHSCDPNAETQKWTVNGELRIGFFTTREIGAGEEVTFDYQYQRYGKEAQRCYCEASTCRGWIGEEPDSEDDEEDEEDEEEGEEVEEGEEGEESGEENEEESESEEAATVSGKPAKKEKAKKKGKKTVAKKKGKAATTQKAKPKVVRKTAKDPTTPKAPRKPRKTARSRRLEMLDDLDLDAEIDALSRTGLKNQAHTLKLSRVMVRAKVPKTRMRLLELIQGAEVPCRRLFLDYHGLRLLHGWMSDAQEQKDGELKMELLRTLHSLPIPNKTMLKDSHVLTAVSNYGGLKLDSERKEIVSEEAQLEVPYADKQRPVKRERKEDVEAEGETGEVVKMEVDENEMTEEELKEVERVEREIEMRKLCKEMVLKWVQLPEVFRIPKKERIEQMKEHEREADLQYETLNMQTEEDRARQNERFKGKNPDEIKWVKKEFKVQPVNDGMSKSQRRHLFAMQVEEQRRMEQRMDAWRHHEFRCHFFGLDPFRVRPEDVPAWVDLENRQWFTYDLTEVPTPPNYVHVTMHPPDSEPAKEEDYEIPKMDLPEGWRYAMDPRGRLYYYHRKIQIPQWELPIKLLPLNQEKGVASGGGGGENRNGIHNGNGARDQKEFYGENRGMGEEDDRNDDSSTTDTCDSSEEEMVKKINRIKKLQKIGVARSTIVKLHLHERNSDDEVTKEEVTKAEEEKASGSSRMMGESKKLPNREGLVEYREISPRREEDRLYGQAEMKRYKETKEKFKQRKEMLKRRKLDKLMKAGLINSDAEKRASFRSIVITDDELYETDDEAEKDEGLQRPLNGELPGINLDVVTATTTAPLMEKIVLGNSRVDELDEPHKYNEMTRLKIRERNAKRSRALKVQMKLKKMKMDEELERKIVNGVHCNGVQLNGGGAAATASIGTPEATEEERMINGINNSIVAGGTPNAASALMISSEKARRIKDKFRSNIAGVIVQHLSPYRRDSCPVGRITNNEDFKHLAKKLTHFVLVKELKHCATVADLSVNDSVKQKSKEFIRKYMSKYGKVYEKPVNEPEY